MRCRHGTRGQGDFNYPPFSNLDFEISHFWTQHKPRQSIAPLDMIARLVHYLAALIHVPQLVIICGDPSLLQIIMYPPLAPPPPTSPPPRF